MSKKLYYIGTTENENVEEYMTSETTIELINDFFPEYQLNEITYKKYPEFIVMNAGLLDKNDLIVLQGGGSIGSASSEMDDMRRQVIEAFPDIPKIVMPVSVMIGDVLGADISDNNDAEALNDKEKEALNATIQTYSGDNLTLLLRDKASFDYAKENFTCKMFLVPDIILYNATLAKKNTFKLRRRERRAEWITQHLIPKDRRSLNVTICSENISDSNADKIKNNKSYSAVKETFSLDGNTKSALTSFLESDFKTHYKLAKVNITERGTTYDKKPRSVQPEAIDIFLGRLISEFLVITDSTFCMLCCALLGIPCIAFDNASGDLARQYEWIKDLKYIHLASNINDAKNISLNIKKKTYRYPYKKMQKLFKSFIDM